MEKKVRTCSQCHKTKPIEEFVRSKGRNGGFRGTCCVCWNLQRALYKEKNKGKHFESQRKYYLSTNGYYSRLRASAFSRGISFDMEKEEFIYWFEQRENICYYCNCKLERAMRRKLSLVNLTIDRKDNSLGYEINNIVKSCRRCNLIKGSWFTTKEMLAIASLYLRPKSLIGGDT